MGKPYIRLFLDKRTNGDQVSETRNIGQTEEQTYEAPVFNRRFTFDCDINDLIRV